MTFRGIVLVLLLIPALAVSYYFAVSLPAHNKATLDFEKQKYHDQLAKERLAQQKAQEDERQAAGDLKDCLSRAQATYDSDIASNGTRNNKGGYSVDLAVQNILQHKKEAAIAECHRQY